MGGLRKYMPITWITMWIGSLALCGVPFFAGFYSKDAIIEAVGESHRWGAGYAYFCVLAGAFVTALYTFRQMYLTFHGKERFVIEHGHDHDAHAHGHVAHADHTGGAHEPVHPDEHPTTEPHHGTPGVLHHPPKESPWVVTLPLILLAIPSVMIGYLAIQPMLYGGWFGGAIHVQEGRSVLEKLGEEFHGPLAMALHGFAQPPFWLVAAAFAITTYIYLFNIALADKIKSALKPIWIVLDRKYWVDNVYFAIFAKGGVALGRALWKGGDAAVIDGVAVNGSASLVQRIASGVRRLQSGYLYHYAFAMILGLILLLGGYWLVGQ